MRLRIMDWVYVGVGSALGGLGRYWLSGWVAERWGETFPWGTLVVNGLGSLAIGFLGALSEASSRIWLTPELRQLLMIGVLGGFTTFSSFSLQTLALVRDGEGWLALGNVTGSVLVCLMSVWVGFECGRGLTR